MVKGLKGKIYEKQLKSLGLCSLEEKAEGRPHCSLQIPQGGQQKGDVDPVSAEQR